jgi:hypothetical protein
MTREGNSERRDGDTAISYCGRTASRREQCIAKSIRWKGFSVLAASI